MAKLSIEQTLLKAMTYTKKGQVAEAQKLYELILHAFPNNKRARQRFAALKKSSKSDSVQSLTQETIDQLISLYNEGKLATVVDQAKALIVQYPESFLIWNILGAANKGLGEKKEAAHAFKKVTEINPSYPDGHNNMGIVLQEQLKIEEAIKAFKKALALKPDYAEAYNNMGNALKDQGKLEKAVDALKKALAIKPNYAEAYLNMGVALKDQGKTNEAIEAYNNALKIKPDFADAYNNMGNLLKSLGKIEAAIQAYKKAICIKPNNAEANHNMGQAELMQLNFTAGFKHCEWRWLTNQTIGTKFQSAKPSWTGEANTRVFVYSEQGIGDVIMYSSILTDACDLSKEIIVASDSRLVSLFKRSFPRKISFISNDEVISENRFDCHIPIGSLPLYLRKDLHSFKKANGQYLYADKNLTENLRKKISNANDKLVCGITWRGGKKNDNSLRNKDISILELGAALRALDYNYVNLQYHSTKSEVELLRKGFNIAVQNISEIDNFNNIDGLAALISACDLVISIDNLTVHVAGALGVQTCVLLPEASDWRWGIDAQTSYWHAALRLFRRQNSFTWEEPLAELVSYLNELGTAASS